MTLPSSDPAAGLELLLTSTPAGLVLADARRRVLACNAGAARCAQRLTGKSLTVGAALDDLAPAAVWSAWAPHFQAALAGNEHTVEESLRDLAGRECVYVVTFSPAAAPASPPGVTLTLLDISQHALTARPRTARTRFLDSLSDLASDGLALTDEQGRIVQWNPVIARITGLPAETALGQYIWEVQSLVMPASQRTPAAEAALLERLHLVYQTGLADWLGRPLETEIERPDGVRVRVETVVLALETPHGYQVASLMRDITARHQMEMALRESEARWQFALEGAGDGVWDWDAVTNHVFFSRRWKAMLGYAEAEVGETLTDWETRVHPDDLASCYTDLQRHFRGETPFYQNEHRMRCQDGSYKWILDRGRVVEWLAPGQPRRVIGTHTDITARRQAETKLLENEERYRQMFTAHSAVMLLIEPASGAIVDANPAAARFYGYPRETLITLNIAQINVLPPDEIAARRREAAARAQSYFVFSHRLASGEVREVEVYSVPVRAQDRTLLYSIIHDITARLEAERALQAQYEFAAQVMDSMGQGLTVTDAAGRFEYVNPAYARLAGRPRADLLGVNPVDLTHPEAAGRIQQEWARRRAGETSTYESELVRPDGQRVPVLITGVPRRQAGQVHGSITSITDLSELKRLEARLRESEARQRALLSAIPDLMFRLRRDGVYLDYAAGASTALLLAPDRIIGSHLHQALGPEQSTAYLAALGRALDTGEVQTVEYALTIREVRKTFEARLVASGPDEVIAIVRDISERARLEQMKSDFINRASHELRTPISTILLMVNLIEKTSDPQELQEYWEVLKSELNRERALIEDLLMVGRLETDHLPMRSEPVAVGEVLARAVEQAQPSALSQQLKLTLTAPAETPEVVGDAKALTQVFVNLLSNAGKFTPAGGAIQVSLTVQPGTVQVEVTDTGIGIPPEDQPNLFTRFFRAGNAIANEVPGSGVGLFIVKSIVEKHGGQITVHSQVGRGTTFTVRLPARAGAAE